MHDPSKPLGIERDLWSLATQGGDNNAWKGDLTCGDTWLVGSRAGAWPRPSAQSLGSSACLAPHGHRQLAEWQEGASPSAWFPPWLQDQWCAGSGLPSSSARLCQAPRSRSIASSREVPARHHLHSQRICGPFSSPSFLPPILSLLPSTYPLSGTGTLSGPHMVPSGKPGRVPTCHISLDSSKN